MKKQEVTGWAYPCDTNILYKLHDCNNARNWQISEQIYLTETDAENSVEDICPCGKGCKPIKVKITVEAV